MCGRFTMKSSPKVLAEHFRVTFPELSARYNVSPTQTVAAVRAKEEGREAVFLRWGLIPSWAKDHKIGAKLINARAETVADKPSFRSAFKHRRCLITADGFFEWKKEGKGKQPYYVTLRDGGPFAFAGLWERWTPEGEDEVQSCTIVTTEPNDLMRPLHDRMPVILDPKDYAQWLDPTPRPKEELAVLLRPYPSEAMKAVAVSSLVNNARRDDPACVEPLE